MAGTALAPAVDGARLDVPVLRLAHLEATLDADGAYDVVLTGDTLETLATVSVTDAAIAVGACTVARGAGRVRITVAGPGIEIGTVDGARVTCPMALDGRVGVGLVAHIGAVLRSLALARLP